MAPAAALTNINIAAEKCWTPKITANATAPAAAASVKSHVGAGGDRAMSSIILTATSGPRRPDTTSSIARIVDATRSISTPAVGDQSAAPVVCHELQIAPARHNRGVQSPRASEAFGRAHGLFSGFR
jgi:hypothetical protein